MCCRSSLCCANSRAALNAESWIRRPIAAAVASWCSDMGCLGEPVHGCLVCRIGAGFGRFVVVRAGGAAEVDDGSVWVAFDLP